MTLTTEGRLGAGAAVRAGTQGAYRAVAALAGEVHVVRNDLADGDATPQGAAIACFAHLTDLHVTDAQSPARFEFINQEWRDPRFRELLPMQRPQEMLNAHAIGAMVRAINSIEAGAMTGSPLQMAVMTGDAIDNTQHNELTNFLALLRGGTVRPDSGAPGYDGVQRADWRSDIYWKPDGPPDGDVFQNALGFPRHPGLLDEAVQPFHAEGLRVPWVACRGNHEEVCQGVGIVTPALARAMTGSRKPIGLPQAFDPGTAVETFVHQPEQFMSGPFLEVEADPARRPIEREEFMPEAYYAQDVGDVRFITLDTVCTEGGADGSIDADQLHWLERKLEEVHSLFRSRDGSRVRTRNQDRYVVLLSHHGYDSLTNPRAERRADLLLALLLRFPNVVLWLNGHIHANRITARKEAGLGHGFWEVTTSSLVDWPCQARLVEIYRTRGGVAISCTMLDHEGGGLAGLHRELAGNVPRSGFDSWRPGSQPDRNAILLLPSPF
ncbi:MAG: TIGR03767 family metallophosphoesterase [Chloroflexi bacterium]|nr:MAG: TIGR03767 family metallophosphoesterase [Chloroflexota bacterium]